MKNCKPLGQITKEFIPEYYDSIDWNNIWERKLENGTAFEWATLAAILYVAKEHGYSIELPLLKEFDAGEYFILRNEMPLTHGAQVGNSATLLHSKPLAERFFYSLVPKAVISKDGNAFSIFREGCPIHKIMCGNNYTERTDIVFFPGKMEQKQPSFNSSKTKVAFKYDYVGEILSGTIRVMNSPYIPCDKRTPTGGTKMLPTGIVECSINKTAEVAKSQLSKYKTLFGTDSMIPAFVLVTGNDLSTLPYPNTCINLKDETIDSLRTDLHKAATIVLHSFNLL